MILPFVVVGALALLALTRPRGAARSTGSASSGAYHATTMAYARAKLSALVARGYTGRGADDLHEAWSRFARALLPGVPYPAWIALGASSEGQHDVVERRPFPSGWWGVERAFAQRLLRSERDHEAFASLDGDASWMDSAAAQTFIAARRFRAGLETLARAVRDTWGEDAFDLERWGPWEYQCAAAVYSAGDGTTAAVLRAARAELVRTGQWQAARSRPRSQWWSLVAIAVWSVAAQRTQRVAWALIRPRERFECARLLAAQRGDMNGIAWCAGDVSWSEDFDRELSAVAFGGEEVRA